MSDYLYFGGVFATYPIPASAYHNGWARKGGIKSDAVAYDYL